MARGGEGRGLLVLIVLTAALYAQTWTAPFVYEDEHWFRSVTEAPTVPLAPSRALTAWSYHLTWQMAGGVPALYHAGNVALHLVNGALVYALATALVPGAGLLAAGVFLLHPLSSSAVAYLAGRSDLLMTTWILLALVLTVHGSSWWRWGLAWAACGLAAMSKEIGIVAPVLLALTHSLWRPEMATRAWIGVWVMAGAAAGWAWAPLLNWIAMPPHIGGSALSWPHYVWLQNAALWHLLALVNPFGGFSIDHDVLAIAPVVRVQMLLLTALCLVSLPLLWRVVPIAAWAVVMVGVSVAPRFVFQTSEFLTEPQMYLPFMAISVLLGVGGHALLTWTPRLQERTA